MSIDVHLRRYDVDDVDTIYEAVVESKVELSRWMPWCNAEYSRQDTKLWGESRTAAWENDLQWCFVIVNGDGMLLGACGIQRLDLPNGVREVGYWVRSSLTGRGIATNATRQICRLAFDTHGLHRLEILTSVENLASQRVAEKAGAIREGILKERFLLNNIRHDCVLFAILNAD